MKKVYTKLLGLFILTIFINSCVSSSKYNALKADFEKEVLARENLQEEHELISKLIQSRDSIETPNYVFIAPPKSDSLIGISSLVDSTIWDFAPLSPSNKTYYSSLLRTLGSTNQDSGNNYIIISPDLSIDSSGKDGKNKIQFGRLNPEKKANAPALTAPGQSLSPSSLNVLPANVKDTETNQNNFTNSQEKVEDPQLKQKIESQSEKLKRILGEIKVAEDRLRQLKEAIRNIEKTNKGNE